MKKIKNIYEEIYQEDFPRYISITELMSVLQTLNYKKIINGNDYIDVTTDLGDGPGTSLTIWKHREETDEEFLERTTPKSEELIGIMAISKREYKELKEKAAKYDDLCK